VDRARATTSWPSSGERLPAEQFQNVSYRDQLAHGPEVDARHEQPPGDAIARNREEEPVGLQSEGRSETLGVNACINISLVSSSTISQLPVGNSTRSAAAGKEWPHNRADVSARAKVPKFLKGTQQLSRPSNRRNVADIQAEIDSCRPGRSQADVLAYFLADANMTNELLRILGQGSWHQGHERHVLPEGKVKCKR